MNATLETATEPCLCGRMDKLVVALMCRCCYLEKEIRYAISELERDQDWPAHGLARLKGLV
jgi:hypothetical protein